MALTKVQLVDLNANELIIDLDGDTSITADTDDQIDIKIAGADDFQFTANKFSVLSGSSQSFADSSKALFGASDRRDHERRGRDHEATVRQGRDHERRGRDHVRQGNASKT